ncbi:MAG: M48 family metallopeptidase [Propionicimonas sp.]|uniref:YgjP-like metallopeptidase domain-containing protein n=1 Tax=Propionicimonas sp. TaxID=1955623 RepID=UPI003D0CD56D
MAEPELEVRRSARRRRTYTVFREQGRLVALVPERMTAAQVRELLPPLVEKFLRREAQRTLPASEDELAARARELFRVHLASRAGAELPPFTIRWVDNQNHRWGSCTTGEGSIRLSSRLRTMPTWVSDYVILHELCHLFVPDHSPAFHHLLAGYPQVDRARAFLHGYEHATNVEGAGEPD